MKKFVTFQAFVFEGEKIFLIVVFEKNEDGSGTPVFVLMVFSTEMLKTELGRAGALSWMTDEVRTASMEAAEKNLPTKSEERMPVYAEGVSARILHFGVVSLGEEVGDCEEGADALHTGTLLGQPAPAGGGLKS